MITVAEFDLLPDTTTFRSLHHPADGAGGSITPGADVLGPHTGGRQRAMGAATNTDAPADDDGPSNPATDGTLGLYRLLRQGSGCFFNIQPLLDIHQCHRTRRPLVYKPDVLYKAPKNGSSANQ